jgi:hypothetical protein
MAAGTAVPGLEGRGIRIFGSRGQAARLLVLEGMVKLAVNGKTHLGPDTAHTLAR